MRHLSDSRLLLLLEGDGQDPHLDACPGCRERLQAWRSLPATLEAAADDDFQRAMPAAHVEASRRRILAAIETQRSGRVVPFPGQAGTSPAAAAQTVRRYPRWMAGAAAGLIVGLLLGRWTHPAGLAPAVTPSQAHVAAHASAGHPAVEAVRYPVPSDDEFLRDLETLRSGPVAAVRTLHELTPQADAHDTLW